tara:strand:- start:1089 stop:1457 length:369 start_codon:yes stop_codon:yes gene_type:complete
MKKINTNMIEVTVRTRADLPSDTIRAFRPTQANYLCVHPQYHANECDRPDMKPCYTVTHIRSGMGMGVLFLSKAMAVQFCETIGERDEWETVGVRGGQQNVPRHFVKEVNALVHALSHSVLN